LEGDACTRAWKTMITVAPRLNSSQAERLCQVALHHSLWKDFAIGREDIRTAVGNCAAALSKQMLSELALDLAAAAAARDAKTNNDHVATVNLLTYVVGLCDDETKMKVREIAFHKGAQLSPEMILVSSKIVERNLFANGIDDWVKIIINDLRLEVQHLKAGEQVQSISGSMMQFTQTANDGSSLVVHIRSGMPIRAALSQRDKISDKVFGELIDAICEGIANPFNLLSNRIHLVQVVDDAAPHLNEFQAEQLSKLLMLIAEGQIDSSVEEMSESEANHPLNRFRMNAGTPSDLQAVSLFALAEIEKATPSNRRHTISAIVGKAMRHPSSRVRSYAFRAWSTLPQLAPNGRIYVLLAAGGSDKQEAWEALVALSEAKGIELTEREWLGLLRNCEAAVTGGDRDMRCVVARCLVSLRGDYPNPSLAAEGERILEGLKTDLCYSVRRIANGLGEE
jgi:hypothetical protein